MDGITYNCRYTEQLHVRVLFIGCNGYEKNFKFIYYLLDLFRTHMKRIDVNLNEIKNIPRFLNEPFTHQIEELVSIYGGVSTAKINEFFENLKLNQPLLLAQISVPTKRRIELNEILLNSNELNLRNIMGITGENLLNFNGSHLYLGICSPGLGTDDIIAWIRKWLDGNDTKLCEALINFNQGFEYDQQKIISEFDTKQWDPTKRARGYIIKGRSYYQKLRDGTRRDYAIKAIGHDIERRDGLLATIRFSDCRRWLAFLVWHNRWPGPPQFR
ncbi:hypothetical protein CAEBREN_20701 [Caenorhabditis brenneri]|uniref:F-box associated domain-containing protein n=1 Tax=Caenorhabditis brenneri TaxID=135651 RepID=G0MF64_CAEBE|nr:hypothetical protein CAEBREN_20701 [Caenorhabditis brenneri]